MNPFKTALWIAKFAASLFLLLVVIPYGLFIGGCYVVSTYREWKDPVFGIFGLGLVVGFISLINWAMEKDKQQRDAEKALRGTK